MSKKEQLKEENLSLQNSVLIDLLIKNSKSTGLLNQLLETLNYKRDLKLQLTLDHIGTLDKVQELIIEINKKLSDIYVEVMDKVNEHFRKELIKENVKKQQSKHIPKT